MKGKRLLILGAAFALGLSACAGATSLVRQNPLKAEGDLHSVTINWSDFGISGTTTNTNVVENTSGYNFTLSSATGTNGISKSGTMTNAIAFPGSITKVSINGAKFSSETKGEATIYLGASSGAQTASIGVFTTSNDYEYDATGSYSFLTLSLNSQRTLKFNTFTVTYAESGSSSSSEPEKEIQELQFVGDPTKTDYYVGDNWDLSGINLRAHYTDNSLEVLGGVPELVAAGKLSVTTNPASANSTDVTYFHLNGTYLVNSMTVYPRQVNNITVSLKSGTEAKPYTVPEARAAIDNNGDKTGVYATGIVSQIVTAYSTQYGNISYNFSEDGSTASPQLQAYRGVGGAVSITSDSDVLVGDKVVVNGNLTKYSSTYEFAANNTLVARKHIQSVAIKTAPSKTTYNAGETFSATGLVLTVNWADDDYADYSYAEYSSMISFSTNALTSSDSGDFAISIFGKTVNQVIVVNNVQAVTSVSVEPASFALEAGKTQQLTSTVAVESGAPQTVNYASSNDAVATVNSNGLVTAVSTGVAKITATSTFDNTKYDYSVVTVINPVGSSSTAYNAVMKYSGSTTGNMTATGNASNVGLDAVVFSVDASTGETTNLPGLNKAGDMRLYSLKSSEATGNGSSFTVSVLDSYEIQYIEIDFAENEQYVVVYAGSDVTNGIDGKYSINSTSFKVENGYVSDGSTNYQVHIDKITIHYISIGGSSVTPDDYLDGASSFANIHGKENYNISEQSETKEVVFGDLSLTNGEQYSDPFNIGDGIVKVTFAGGANDGKYYTTGNGIRTYENGTVKVSSTSAIISSITFTWSGETYAPTSNVANVGSYDAETGVWSGSASEVVLTKSGSGQWRLQSVEVTYNTATLASVGSVSLEFGAKISKTSWDAIEDNSDWPINEFGIMLFKTRQASVPTVEEVFNATPAKTVAINNTQYDVALEEDGDNYSFSVKVNISSVASYDIYFCAAPYVVIDGEYYFLDNMKYSVQSLATYYLSHSGSSLSTDALNMLAGN